MRLCVIIFRKLFEETREKMILPGFLFPNDSSENFEWGLRLLVFSYISLFMLLWVIVDG